MTTGWDARNVRGAEVGWVGWLTAVAGPLAVSGVLVVVRGEAVATNAALVLVLPVLLAALLGGRWGGVMSAIAAALCFDFFFTRPYYSLTIDQRTDVETTVVLLIVGVVVGELVVRTRRTLQLSAVRQREIEQIQRVAALASGAGPAGGLIRIVEREVVGLLHARGARFEKPPFSTVLPQLGHGMVTVPSGDPAPGREHGPAREIEIPVWGNGRQIGRFVVELPTGSVGTGISSEDRAVAVALVDQLGALLAAGAT
jgi:hypothetical protein